MRDPAREVPTGTRRDLETRTAQLYGDIHAIIPPETVARYRAVLSPAHLDAPHDFFAGRRCLDAGCGGTGRALFSLVAHGAARAVGVDLSLENVRGARAHNAAVGERTSLALASLLHLPFPDRCFDFVHCSGVLHHLQDYRAGFQELVRVLQEGGTLYLGVYGRGGLIPWLVGASRAAARLIPRRWTHRGLRNGLRLDPLLVSNILDILYVPVQHRFTEAEVRRWFREAGLADPRRLRNPTGISHGLLHRLLHASAWQPGSRLGRVLHGEGWIIMRASRRAGGAP